MGDVWVLSVVIPILFAAYIWLNDIKLKRLPPEASSFSPDRWSEDAVKETSERLGLSDSSSLLEGKLPPKTGRRYIVVGGVSYFLHSLEVAYSS